jgi:FkbM family methyltransferase
VAKSLWGRKPLVETTLASSNVTVLVPWADGLGNVVVTFGDNEPSVFRFIATCVACRSSEEDLFIDIGANIGVFSLRIAEQSPQVKVVSYEPNPEVASLLHYNANRNGLAERIDIRQIALGDKDMSSRLETVAGDSGVSTINDDSVGGVPVVMRRLCTEMTLDQWKRVIVLKVDVEGFEMSVFKGAEVLFQKHLPVLVFEVNRPSLAARGFEPRNLGEFLRRLGYHELHALDKVLYPPENGLYEVCNIVALPDRKRDLAVSYGFSSKFRPCPEKMWPVVHFEL